MGNTGLDEIKIFSLPFGQPALQFNLPEATTVVQSSVNEAVTLLTMLTCWASEEWNLRARQETLLAPDYPTQFLLSPGSGCINTNFCVYYAQKSSCTQNRGSDAYNVCKKTRLSLNMSQTEHDTNDHGTYVSMWKESSHCLQRKFYVAESCDELSGKGAFGMWRSFLCFFFRWCMHFQNFCMQISCPLAYGVRISS